MYLPYARHRCAGPASQVQKMHLTPLIFLEIDDTNGLTVKDEGITADKIDKKAPYYVVPRWTYKIAASGSYDEPNDFANPIVEGSIVSFGDIVIDDGRLAVKGIC